MRQYFNHAVQADAAELAAHMAQRIIADFSTARYIWRQANYQL